MSAIRQGIIALSRAASGKSQEGCMNVYYIVCERGQGPVYGGIYIFFKFIQTLNLLNTRRVA